VDSQLPDQRNKITANLKQAWPILLVILGLNFWYDYYHPAAILVDVIIMLVLIWKFSK
jgi:hypothetical protein